MLFEVLPQAHTAGPGAVLDSHTSRGRGSLPEQKADKFAQNLSHGLFSRR